MTLQSPPPLWYHYFPAQSSLGADILVYWIGKMVWTCAPGGSRTLDFLHARQAPYPLGQALRLPHQKITTCIFMECNYLLIIIKMDTLNLSSYGRYTAMFFLQFFFRKQESWQLSRLSTSSSLGFDSRCRWKSFQM